jgi:hypothetical protein
MQDTRGCSGKEFCVLGWVEKNFAVSDRPTGKKSKSIEIELINLLKK